MDVYARLNELGIKLPQPPAAGGVYTPVMVFDHNLAYLSGCGPANEVCMLRGKLGSELTVEQGKEAARAVALNMLAVLHQQLGDLNRVEKIVKVLGFVSSAPDFYQQPQVMNGASELFVQIGGEEKGKAARSAIGVAALPENIPVEIEALIELNEYMLDFG